MEQYKTMVGPVISSALLVFGSMTGHKIDSNLQDQITMYVCAGILFGTNVWGIYHNHRKDVQPNDTTKGV